MSIGKGSGLNPPVIRTWGAPSSFGLWIRARSYLGTEGLFFVARKRGETIAKSFLRARAYLEEGISIYNGGTTAWVVTETFTIWPIETYRAKGSSRIILKESSKAADLKSENLPPPEGREPPTDLYLDRNGLPAYRPLSNVNVREKKSGRYRRLRAMTGAGAG